MAKTPNIDRDLDVQKVIHLQCAEGNVYFLRLWDHWIGMLTCKFTIMIYDHNRRNEPLFVDRSSMEELSVWLAKAVPLIDGHESTLAHDLQRLIEDKPSAAPKA